LLLAVPLARGISSPLLVWLVLARFLLFGLEMPLPADVGASPRCLVYWLLPRRLTLRPAPFLCDSFSCAGGGGLSGCEAGGGDACEVVLALGVSSGSPSAMGLACRSQSTLLTSRDSPSCLLRPALACRRLAASIRALSRSMSFSRCSYCLAVIAASARAFLERLPPSLSSSESSSIAPSLERDRPVSETRRARLTSCLTL
jgi:hypothetical protein